MSWNRLQGMMSKIGNETWSIVMVQMVQQNRSTIFRTAQCVEFEGFCTKKRTQGGHDGRSAMRDGAKILSETSELTNGADLCFELALLENVHQPTCSPFGTSEHEKKEVLIFRTDKPTSSPSHDCLRRFDAGSSLTEFSDAHLRRLFAAFFLPSPL
jgi:hypothetical protein